MINEPRCEKTGLRGFRPGQRFTNVRIFTNVFLLTNLRTHFLRNS